MKRTLLGLYLTILLVPFALAASSPDCNARAGGVSVLVPGPGIDFVETGADKHAAFDAMVPDKNLLLCAFVPPALVPRIVKPVGNLDRYMLVEVSRALENEAATDEAFNGIVAAVKQQLGDSSQLNRTFKDIEAEVRQKLRKDNASDDISIGQPIPLGTLFQMKDAYSFAAILPITTGGQRVRMLNASILLRVNNRFLFVYLYADYKDEATYKWIGDMAEGWARHILAANTK